MKNQACWKDLNAQSGQKVIEELSDAFQSWFDVRQNDKRRIRLATANMATHVHEARLHSKWTASNTIPRTTVSACRKGQT